MSLHPYIPILLIIIYLLICIIGLRLQSKQEEPFLNFDFTTKIRGMSILAIVFSHVINMLYFDRLPSDNFIQCIFNILAPICVGIFLFLSGYGNNLSIKKRGNFNWIKNRVLKLYIPTSIVILCTLFFALIFNITSLFPKSYSVIKDIFLLTQPSFMSWYLKVQLLAYITLYLFWSYYKKYYVYLFILFWLLFVIYFILAGKQACWWISTLCLPLGLLCAEQKLLISKIINLKPYFYFFLSLSICLSLVLLLLIVHIIGIRILPVCIIFVLCLCISCGLIPVGYILNLKSKLLDFLGSYSLEIYLVHLCCISIFEKLTFLNTDIKIVLTIIITGITVKMLKNLSDAIINKLLKDR